MLEPTFVMSQQQMREMALNAMTLAVDAQSAALKSMDREHSLGMENTYAVDRLRGQVKDLVQSTQTIVRVAQTGTHVNETREQIQSLVNVVRRLKADADRFKEESTPRAKCRYDHLLMELGVDDLKPADDSGEKPLAPSDAPAVKAPTSSVVGREPRKLTAQAGFACLRAEVDEHLAFSMQIHAVCNLALEYVLNAAAESSRSNGNI